MKLLVSDYDRTFYTNNDDIKKNVEKVTEFINLGNLFIIASGRFFNDFKNAINKHNLIFNYAIINHGATIIDDKFNVLFNINIDSNILPYLIKDLDLTNFKSYTCCNVLDDTNINSLEITKICVRYFSDEEALKMSDYINQKYSNFVNAYFINNCGIEIISHKINKAIAINLIKEKHHNIDDVYTIGDGYNDIDMIKAFKGYAMKNGIDELKKCAIKEYESVFYLIEDIINNKV